MHWSATEFRGLVNRIAVTGAAGFVGRFLCDELARREIRPIALDRVCLESNRLEAVLRGASAMVHLAGRAHKLRDHAKDSRREYQLSNVELTRRVAAACVGARVRRIVFVSSAGVLGDASPPQGFDDTCTPSPHDDYTSSKLAAENLLYDQFGSQLEIVIIRPPMVYGPGAPANFARILRVALSGWPLPIGSLSCPRSLISVRNLCDVLARAATSHRATGMRMLVADAETTTIAELVQTLSTAAGRRARLIRVPSRLMVGALRLVGRDADVRRVSSPFILCGTLARSELGWAPPFRLADELAWTAQQSVLGHSGD